eukprot:559987-Rhodomonas_salina.2
MSVSVSPRQCQCPCVGTECRRSASLPSSLPLSPVRPRPSFPQSADFQREHEVWGDGRSGEGRGEREGGRGGC